MLTSLLRGVMRRLADERGQALPIVASAMLALLLTLGLITDGGNGFQNKQSLQNAADASAIAAALEIAQGNCTPATPGPCANYAGMYARMNNAGGDSGTTADPSPLPACPDTVTNTNPPSTFPGCYIYPYVDSAGTHDDEVEVWLHRQTSNFFGGLFHIANQSESARAVAGITSGQPPPFTFVTFDSACENHTLLIRNSGALGVNQNIYDDAACGPAHDAFDLFGPGGTITAPDIFTRTPGWEDNTTTTGHTIFLHGQLPPNGNACPYKNSTIAGAVPPLCPEINQPNYQILSRSCRAAARAARLGQRQHRAAQHHEDQPFLERRNRGDVQQQRLRRWRQGHNLGGWVRIRRRLQGRQRGRPDDVHLLEHGHGHPQHHPEADERRSCDADDERSVHADQRPAGDGNGRGSRRRQHLQRRQPRGNGDHGQHVLIHKHTPAVQAERH
jgi:hypothetical protein